MHWPQGFLTPGGAQKGDPGAQPRPAARPFTTVSRTPITANWYIVQSRTASGVYRQRYTYDSMLFSFIYFYRYFRCFFVRNSVIAMCIMCFTVSLGCIDAILETSYAQSCQCKAHSSGIFLKHHSVYLCLRMTDSPRAKTLQPAQKIVTQVLVTDVN